MKDLVGEVTNEFLKETNNKPTRIIAHNDTDSITATAILIKTLQRLDKKFTVKITKGLNEEIINKELTKHTQETLIFCDQATQHLEHFNNLQEPVFIIDKHKPITNNNNQHLHIINPHLTDNPEENNCSTAGMTYLLATSISPENKDLATTAVIGMIGARTELNNKINKEITQETEELTTKKGLIIYPATRPLKRALEYSTSPYIPGVTGNGPGVTELLKETNINPEKSLLELNEEEMSKLITAVMVRRAKRRNKDDMIGNLYILKHYGNQEDVRELSVLINACSRLGHSDIALAYCLGNNAAKIRAQDLYTQYRQEIVSGIRIAEDMNKTTGRGFVILNAEDKIKDAIVGIVCSMLSNSPTYEEGTILIGLAHDKENIKLSARIAGRSGRNLKELIEKTTNTFKEQHPNTHVEYGGHEFAAGCSFNKEKEKEFMGILTKNLEIEVVKI